MDFLVLFFFFKQKTAYEMRISDWSSDVCSSDLHTGRVQGGPGQEIGQAGRRLPVFSQVQHREPSHIHEVGKAQVPPRDIDELRVAFGSPDREGVADCPRSEEHTSELQSLMRNSYAVFCLKKKKKRYMRKRTTKISN